MGKSPDAVDLTRFRETYTGMDYTYPTGCERGADSGMSPY